MSTFLRSVGIGIAGGIAAAIIWVTFTSAFGREFGWLACAIGLSAGLAIRRFNPTITRGVAVSAAVLATIAVISSAKYFVASSLAAQRFAVLRSQLVTVDEDMMIATVADEIAQERLKANQPVAWPAGMTYEDAMEQEDYPADIWAAARERWSKFTKGEQERRIAAHEDKLNHLASQLQSRLSKKRVAATYGLPALGWPLAGLCVAVGCTAFRRDD
jgi:hypothetical protein